MVGNKRNKMPLGKVSRRAEATDLRLYRACPPSLLRGSDGKTVDTSPYSKRVYRACVMADFRLRSVDVELPYGFVYLFQRGRLVFQRARQCLVEYRIGGLVYVGSSSRNFIHATLIALLSCMIDLSSIEASPDMQDQGFPTEAVMISSPQSEAENVTQDGGAFPAVELPIYVGAGHWGVPPDRERLSVFRLLERSEPNPCGQGELDKLASKTNLTGGAQARKVQNHRL
jgi:hypothetical protein